MGSLQLREPSRQWDLHRSKTWRWTKQVGGDTRREAFLFQVNPLPPGRRQDRGASLGATAQEALSSSHLRTPTVNGLGLAGLGCGRCVLPSVIPGGILPSHHGPPCPCRGPPSARCGWLTGSVCFYWAPISEMLSNREEARNPQIEGPQGSQVCGG